MNPQDLTPVQEIRGVLLPVGPRLLVLPNAVVAEILSFQSLVRETGKPDWWLGHLEWRGQQVPVVSFGMALGLSVTSPSGKQRRRIVILNSPGGGAEMPYLGLHTLGVARLVRLTSASLAPDHADAPGSPLIRASLIVGGLPAWIPDLDQLERMVAAFRE